MKYISRNHINLGFLIIVLFSITLVMGTFHHYLFIFTGVCLLSYLILDKKKLRCPNCGVFENLDRLMYAKNNLFYCRRCGEQLVVK